MTRLRRSVLAVPGSNPRMMEKAAASAADEVFLDLEDACAPLEKPAARAKVVEALRIHDWHGKTRVVRINQVTSAFAFDDLREVVTGAGDILDCIMVPKVRNAGDVAFVDRALLQLEQALGYDVGRIGIEAQIEDAEGLMRADEIAFSSDRLETLTYGPADFSASMQLPSLSVRNDYNYPGDIFHYVLFKLAVAARAAGIQVIDGPYLAIHDVEGYRAAASRAAALGYDGKWVLHPVQIEPANETFTPAQADFDKAARILEAYRQATEVDRKGAVMLGDEMIDEASRKIAAQFYARGVAAGLTPSPARREESPRADMGALDDGRLIAFVPTTDLPRARAFYAETLGLPVAEESPFACVFDANGTMLRLTPVRKLSRVRYTVLGWGVDDIASTAGRLAAAGVAFVRYRGMELDEAGIWTAPAGDRVAWFEDPDGNLLSVTQFST